MNTKHQFTKADIGCVIDGSAESADYINEETIDFAKRYGFECEAIEDNDDYSQILSEEADSAVSFLNDIEGPQFCYWQFEDNSLFYVPDVETARESVDFVSVRSLADARRMGIETSDEDSEYPPDDFEGEWLHVNDHGNATLYVREKGNDIEVWSIV